MINANYVDGLELRIKKLNKKLSDESNAALQLIAENNSLKAERDALAAQVEALHEKLGKALDLAETGAANNWHAEGDDVAWIDEQLKEHAKGAATPQQHLAEIMAQAVIDFANHVFAGDDCLHMNLNAYAKQYADSIQQESK